MKTDISQYRHTALFCGLYALFYTFCLYRNYSGVTFPFFVAGTLCFFVYYMKKQGLTLKKYSYFLMIVSLLLGVHIFLSSSFVLTFLDRCLIIVLFFVLFLHNIYDDSTWDLSRYTSAVATTVVSSVVYIFHPVTDLVDAIKGKNGTAAKTDAQPQRVHVPEPGHEPQPDRASGYQPEPGHEPQPDRAAGYQPAPGFETHREQELLHELRPDQAPSKSGVMKHVLLGLGISVPILAIVLPLLITSDAVFSDLMGRIFNFEWNMDIIGVAVMIIIMYFVCYAFRMRLTDRDPSLDQPVADMRTHSPVTAITISCVLLVFYLIYCIIQIVYLFMGYGKLPAGYTYAEYVHEGFYQLVFICIINIALVLICRKFSQDNRGLKLALMMISGCTFIMIFSAGYRMLLYIGVYRFTFLRLFVLWSLVVIAFTMIGTIVYIFKPDMPFVKYCIVMLTVTWLVFVYINPDYRIAQYNLTHTNWAAYKEDPADPDYLPVDNIYIRDSLSSDAASAVVKYSKSDKFTEACLKDYTEYDRSEHDIYLSKDDDERISIRRFNYSVWTAARLAGKE